MAMWTKAQQKVIDTRNKNLLVSAAAGSGKTAVLVERIISMISEGVNPLDIDHLLVVTFTNAAAAQMRDRIGKALDKKLTHEPANAHLQRQVSLLQSAHITTIHSFCLNVIRNYFHHIDLDPSFKMAEESEITLMKSDIIADVLEKWYEEEREDFFRLIESYSHSKSDAPIEDLVLSLYNFAMSNPWPRAWLDSLGKAFRLDTIDDMNKAPWMKELISYVSGVITDLMKKLDTAISICNEADGPKAYLPALISDREMLSALMNITSYEGYAYAFSNISYTRLSSKKQEDVPEYKKNRVKGLRDELKKGIKDLTSSFFFAPIEDILKDMQSVGSLMETLAELTKDFMDAFAAKKEEKNLIDFNDLEHFALRILIEEKDGEIAPTRAAMELSEHFDEILIDEYQDSNLVQETILKAISREHIGLANRFMVGDVKQSIYKFRLAMPELFLEKYKSFSTCDEDENGNINVNQRIDLDKNFRSRKTVLDFVNLIFRQIMTEPVGGIRYDDAASLKYGELYEELMLKKDEDLGPDIRNRIAQDVELILVTEEEAAEEEGEGGQTDNEVVSGDTTDVINEKKIELYDEEEEIQYTRKELEARAIARRIKELTDPERGLLLFDKDENGNLTHRPARLSDIVILLRTMTGWSDVFVNTLMQEGIPAYADTGTGYFQTIEIMTILNMLRIIDNPRQDIPITGVLYSRIGGFSSEELTHIRLIDRKETMYKACLLYAKEGSNEDLKKKVNGFLDMLHSLRDMMKYTPIHELIQRILDMTGYSYYVMAMPGGDRRKANIDMLISLAVGFEKGSYRSLFHFIRYVEKLQKYDVDYGEASVSGEQEDIVRIMSIHKSKGLEFPVVFVGGLSKQFNMQDQRSKILFDVDYGAGPDYIDIENRTRIATLLKKVIQKKSQIDSLGEELRVLYVAMTRAKEKLIMTGYLKSVKDLDKGKDFSFYELMSTKSYMDLVLPAMNNAFTDYMTVKLLRKSDIVLEEMVKQAFLQQDSKDIEADMAGDIRNEAIKKEIEKRLYYKYPYTDEAKLKVKLSVSELKKLGQFVDDEDSELLYGNTDVEVDITEVESDVVIVEKEAYINENQYIPEFIKGTGAELTGTDRGTLYHKVLELLKLSRVNSYEDLHRELEDMAGAGKITKEDIGKLNTQNIFRFTQSDVAGRIIKAEAAGRVYREKQFVLGLAASDVYPGNDSDELILVQGIIDLFFEEDGELVLLDYKSDIVEDESRLIDRYRVQLIYYKKALEQILNKRVKEMIIYSLYLGKEIQVV
jgi:ATP-dependent helicase/nuclease subunit A